MANQTNPDAGKGGLFITALLSLLVNTAAVFRVLSTLNRNTSQSDIARPIFLLLLLNAGIYAVLRYTGRHSIAKGLLFGLLPELALTLILLLLAASI